MSATPHARSVALWLFACSAMVVAMVVIGGLTRLTGSGLSMVQWAPLLGWFPPLTTEAWQAVFDLYKTSPEFLIVNSSMDLEGFKAIFWLEYIHRLLGRSIGLVFLFPFLYFFATGKMDRRLTLKLLLMFVLGALQGGLGWYMVKSGLVDDPHVSPYRLTAHLGMAVLILGYMLWVGLGLFFGNHASDEETAPLYPGLATASTLLTGLILCTLLSGGFVAGLHAGLIYNTFPLMDGNWIPEGYLAMEPVGLNFFENIATVQWDHRVLAVTTLTSVLVFCRQGLKRDLPVPVRKSLYLLMTMAISQVSLGIATLLLVVPIPLASLHQTGALFLFTIALFVTHRLRHTTGHDR